MQIQKSVTMALWTHKHRLFETFLIVSSEAFWTTGSVMKRNHLAFLHLCIFLKMWSESGHSQNPEQFRPEPGFSLVPFEIAPLCCLLTWSRAYLPSTLLWIGCSKTSRRLLKELGVMFQTGLVREHQDLEFDSGVGCDMGFFWASRKCGVLLCSQLS